MNFRSHFIDLLEYDRWAMSQILRELKEDSLEASPEQELFIHIALAQLIWVDRLNEVKPTRSAFEKVKQTLDQSGELASEAAATIEKLLNEMNEARFEEVLNYRDLKGNPYHSVRGDILHHVFNHGTHHRAQINMMLRKRGIAPTPIDYIFFKRRDQKPVVAPPQPSPPG